MADLGLRLVCKNVSFFRSRLEQGVVMRRLPPLRLLFQVLDKDSQRPLQNLTPSSIIIVFEHYWLTRSQYFWFLGCICSISSYFCTFIV